MKKSEQDFKYGELLFLRIKAVGETNYPTQTQIPHYRPSIQEERELAWPSWIKNDRLQLFTFKGKTYSLPHTTVRLWSVGGRRYLEVLAKTTIKHPDLPTKSLTPGVYRVNAPDGPVNNPPNGIQGANAIRAGKEFLANLNTPEIPQPFLLGQLYMIGEGLKKVNGKQKDNAQKLLTQIQQAALAVGLE